MTSRRRLLLSAAVVTVLAAAALSTLRGPGELRLAGDPPRRSAAVEAACRRLAAALPDDLGPDLDRRDTADGTPSGFAAYGDPPVVVRCGVPVATTYEPGDQLIVVNGVEWDIDEKDDGALLCSLPRALVNVEVSFPGRYKAERLSLLAEAVRQAQPL